MVRGARDRLPQREGPCAGWGAGPGSASGVAFTVRGRGGHTGRVPPGACPAPEHPVLASLHPHALTAPACDPPFQGARAGGARTYPERPQGVVGAVGLLPRAPVHETLQLDQQELLGSGGDRGRRSLRAGADPGRGPRVGGSSEPWAPRGAHVALSLGLDPASAAGSRTGCEPRHGHLAAGSHGFVSTLCPPRLPSGWSEQRR